MRRVLLRPWTAMLVVVVVAFATAAGGFAWWSASGSGSASASVGTINAPSNVTAAAANSSDGGAHGTTPVTVSWSAPSGGAVAPTGYYVTRYDENNSDSQSAACGTSAGSPTTLLSCADSVASGRFHYAVTAVYHTWTATSTASNTVTIINDTTPPTSAITFPGNGSYNQSGWTNGCTTARICGTASDPGTNASGVDVVAVSIKRSLDDDYWNGSTWVAAQTFNTASTSDSWAHWSYALAASNLTDGVSYTVAAKATDNAANVQTPLATSTFTYDRTAPSIAVGHVADGLNGWNKTTPVTVSVTVSDTGSGIAAKPACTVDGSSATVSGTSSPYSVSVTGNGTHPVACSVSDNAGNSNSGNDSVKIDTAAPSGTSLATNPAANGNGWINTTPVTVTLSGTTDTGGSGVALVKYTTDGSDPTTSGTAQTYNSGSKPQVSATTTFKYAAQDAAGNWETVHTTTVQIDTAPPTGGTFTVAGTASTAGGATATLTNSTSFTISARSDYTDVGSGLASSVLTVQSESLTSIGCGALGSGGPFATPQTITGTTQPTGIVAGACYVYVLTGTDKAGNTASVSVTVVDNSVSFQITQQPTSVTAGQATSGTNNVILTATKNGATDTTYSGATLTWSGANISPSGTAATLPTSPTWTNGQASFSITLVKAETETLSVSDGTRSSGNFAPITVNAGTASNYAITNVTSQGAGTLSNPCYFSCTDTGLGNNQTFTAKISVTDSVGNIVTGLGSGHTVTIAVTQQQSGGTFTAPTTGQTVTLTISSTGAATSTAAFSYKASNNGTWTDKIAASTPTGQTTYTTANLTVTKL